MDEINEYRQQCSDLINEYEVEFDNKMTYILCGALALSITFGTTDTAYFTCFTKWLFILGLLSLLFAIGSHLLQFLYCKWILRDVINKIDNKIIITNDKLRESQFESIKKIEMFNKVVFTAFLFGIFCITLFAIISILNK